MLLSVAHHLANMERCLAFVPGVDATPLADCALGAVRDRERRERRALPLSRGGRLLQRLGKCPRRVCRNNST
eukprot:SAG11_NODE_36142_length_263_cov_0.628049_1_plen_71_part_10